LNSNLEETPQALISPGQTIGILGGGQLGRMIINEGRKMGFHFVTLDPDPDCPGAQASDRHIAAQYDDWAAVAKLAGQCDLIVYEFENIPPEVVEHLEKIKPLPQGSRLLKTTRHRLREKKALRQAGVPVARFQEVNTFQDLMQAVEELGWPAVLKTTTGGYDGKGQWILHSRDDMNRLPDGLFREGKPFILEEWVPFEKEISVVVARSIHGEMAAFPPAVNVHRNHILHLSVSPAPVSDSVIRQAVHWAKQIAESLEVVGLIAVEMFCMEDGRLLVNELAPRPHNSGHYTYDACLTSQFEQLIRAVAGLPLGPAEQVKPAVMVNLLGEHMEMFRRHFPRLPGDIKPHWYGKKEAKPGRKMGHLTLLGRSMEEAVQWMDGSGIWPPLTRQEKKVIYNRDS
jgi:5-(carboxyamino)imidazole ribonucleotide synthase